MFFNVAGARRATTAVPRGVPRASHLNHNNNRVELHHLLGCDETLACEDLVGQEDDGILCIPTFGQYANCSGSENWLVGPSGCAGPASLRS